jgi:hypothetical protein
MKRHFQKFRDDRFALTTLQNPDIEVRTYAELVQAAQPVAQPLLPALSVREGSVQTPAQFPATQPLATPPAPDSIPIMEFPEDDSAAPPEPDPAAPAPLDSAPIPRHKIKTIPKSRRRSKPLHTPALARALAFLSTTGNTDAAETVDDQPDQNEYPEQDESPELTAAERHAPRPRRKPKSKSRRKSNRRTATLDCPPPTPSLQKETLAKHGAPKTTPLERHARKCAICRHPLRQMIEESFLHWRSPQTIMHCFDIKTETSIYHHAHAFNFFALRNRNLQSALANIVETIDTCNFTGAEMLHAVRSLAHISEDGRWIHPTSKSEFMYSMQRLADGAPRLAATESCPPAFQNALPAHTDARPVSAGDEILIASDSNIKKRCNSLKTILSYSG